MKKIMPKTTKIIVRDADEPPCKVLVNMLIELSDRDYSAVITAARKARSANKALQKVGLL